MIRRYKQMGLILAALALLGCVWLVQMPLTAMQHEHDLSPVVQRPIEVIPILVLGGFRGVVVDFLWVRGMARHQEKRFFELKTIFDVIANLQPNIPDVWIFQGWNMSYNIAHNMETREGKWKWVSAGLKYIERGTHKNPTNGEIRAALGHTYRHKFSHKVFPFKRVQYYREQLAKEGLDNFDEAVKWYREALKLGMKITMDAVIARCIAHTYHQAAQVAQKEERWGDAARRFKQCLAEWQRYRSHYPDDTGNFFLGNCSIVGSGLGQLYCTAGKQAKAAGRGAESRRLYRLAADSYRQVIETTHLPLLPHHMRLFKTAVTEAGILSDPNPGE